MASSASITYGKYLANARTRTVREFFQPATDVPSFGINGLFARSQLPAAGETCSGDIKQLSPDVDVARASFDQRSM